MSIYGKIVKAWHSSMLWVKSSWDKYFSGGYKFRWLLSFLHHTRIDFCVIKQLRRWGFPGGAVVENLPASAGDTGSGPGLGRSHMPRSNWARDPQLLSLCVWSLCSTTREAATVRGPRTAMKSGPHLPQLEKVLAQKWRPNTAINKKNK